MGSANGTQRNAALSGGFRFRRSSSRAWHLLSALVAVALLVAACGSDGAESDTSVAAPDESTDASTPAPEPTPEPEPTATSEPTAAPEPTETETEVAAGLATQGRMTAQCVFGAGGPSPESGRIRAGQDCTMDSEDVLPIAIEQQLLIEFVDEGPASTYGDPIIGFSQGDDGHVYGGYVTGAGDGRFVSTVLGTDPYGGAVIHVVGHSPGDGNVTFDWYVGDGPQPFGALGDFEEMVEVAIECSPTDVPADAAGDVTAAETCTYTSNDPRLSLEPTTDLIRSIEVDDAGRATGALSYYIAETDTGVVRGGLADENGVRRWAGVVNGLGEIDGVVHEVGWAQTGDDGVTAGVIVFSFG